MKRARRPGHFRRLLLALAFSALPGTWSERAGADAQMERKAAIVARVLSFERSFSERVRGALDFVIVHQQANTLSELCARDWLAGFEVLASAKVQGRPLTAVKAAYDAAALAQASQAGHVEVLIVCPGLEREAAELAGLARARRVLTVGDSTEAVERHFSLAVISTASKLQLYINITTSKQEGVTLSSDVLKVAKVLR